VKAIAVNVNARIAIAMKVSFLKVLFRRRRSCYKIIKFSKD